jgi:hypothetical protein
MVDADPQAQSEDRLTMPRVAGALLLVALGCGTAFAADLQLQPKGRSEEPAAPAAPAPPVAAPPAIAPPAQLQTTTPPVAPVQDGKEKPAITDQKPVDTLQLPQAGAPSQGESWWQQIVRNAPNCKTFSDGCRRCDVSFRCSGLPIACQPKEFTCIEPQP